MGMKTMKLTNLTGSDFRLPTGHLIPAKKSIDLPRSVVAHVDNQSYLSGLERGGKVRTGASKEKPPHVIHDPEQGPFSRKGLAEMSRAHLVEVAEMHGVEPEVYKGMKVDELREFVARIIFVDL